MKNKYPLLFFLCLVPLLSMAQLQSNTSKPDTSRLKTMDLPKRKAKTVKITPDAVLQKILGDQTTEIIAKAQIINAYEVESFVSENALDNVLEGFKILQMEQLSGKQADYIKQLILSEKTYFLTEGMKQCLFLPKLGLQFVHNNDTSTILISFKCDFARFYHGSPFTLNTDYGHEDLIEFFHDVFPMELTSVFAAQPVKLANTLQPIYYTVQLGDGWIIVAQKATNTLHEKVSVADLCKWNGVPIEKAQTNQRFLFKGETIIVGFKK